MQGASQLRTGRGSLWRSWPLNVKHLIAIVVAMLACRSNAAGQTWLETYVEASNPLLTGCEMPTHSSISLQQGRWTWSAQVMPARHGNIFSMASNLPPVRTIEGTLISRRHVLTTSIDIGSVWEKLKVRFRTNDGLDIDVNVRRRTVLNDTVLGRRNFAILELDEEVKAPKFPDEIRPICILHPDILSNRTTEQLTFHTPTLSAFTNSLTNNLCQLSVKFIPDEQCQQEFEPLTGERTDLSAFICDDLDKCNDLVGAIAMVQDDEQKFQLVGMLTFVYNQYAPEASYPSLFERLTREHINWIERVIRQRV